MSRALGRYELLRPLARGGMAEVYLARRRAAGVEKWLVVKRMRPERAGDTRFLDLFVREARLSMSLAHQNIVPVFDFGRIDDQVFLAMERVEGKDLGACLTKGHTLPPLLAAFVAAECCQALDYAHLRRGPDGTALGIVHRDVTPRNVLLSWSGEVKLTDFGIAALAGEDSSKIIGTPAYMAPEQARGEPIDARADVYAVGLILREALTGVRGRKGDDRESTLASARTGELADWNHEPAALAAIADHATSIDPAERYADARAMLAALDTFIVGERAAHAADSPSRQLADWLAAMWRDARDDVATDDAIEGSQLVSFLDDGALDVIGTGTVRSMAATIGDDEPAKPEPAPAPKRSRKRELAIAGGAVAAIAAFAIVELGGKAHDSAAVVAPVEPPTHVAPAPMPAPPPPAVVQPPPPPAKIEPPPVPKLAKRKLAPTPTPTPTPTLALHKVMVNAVPWAFFTVDDTAEQLQTMATIRLAAGPHVLHFSHNAMHRDLAIQVPDDDQLKIVVDLSH
ncbi:MAG TPA: serine/threonine-protein kinase [Kofleriaceae bacterium]|jgi:serine/threonine-protein kinase